MTDFSSIIAKVTSVASSVAAMLPGGIAVTTAADAVKSLIDEVKTVPHLTGEQVEALDASRDALEAAVVDHARRTSASLGDG